MGKSIYFEEYREFTLVISHDSDNENAIDGYTYTGVAFSKKGLATTHIGVGSSAKWVAFSHLDKSLVECLLVLQEVIDAGLLI